MSADSSRRPTWRSAASDAEAALRQARLATTSLDRFVPHLRELGEASDRAGRVDTARRLAEGADGGALALLTALAEGGHTEPGSAERTGRALLERLKAALDLEPVGERGEFLKLDVDQVREFEVRGDLPAGDGPFTCRLVRCGWRVGDDVVARPLIEPVEDAHA